MNPWRVAAAGVADGTGVAGTAGTAVRWTDIDVDPRDRIRWKSVFAEPFADFRRLDRLSRFCCLAVEAAAPTAHLDADQRADTAVVLASTLGCLHSDLRFAAGLEHETEIEPAVFPYTLPSTCLGDVAIRHKLTGPTLCLTTAPGDESKGLRETGRLLAAGEAAAAVVCVGDVCLRGGTEHLGIAALVVVPGPPQPGDLDPESVAGIQKQLWSVA